MMIIRRENRYIDTDQKWVKKGDTAVLSEEQKDKTDTEGLERIFDIVADHYGTTAEELISVRRDSKLVMPRQVAIFLCLNREDTTYEQMAAFMHRQKSTIMLAEKTIWELLEEQDKKISDEIKNLFDRIDRDIYEDEI